MRHGLNGPFFIAELNVLRYAYATNRFERCKTRMSTEVFAGHIDAVRIGTLR